jgi:hypothetical protein
MYRPVYHVHFIAGCGPYPGANIDPKDTKNYEVNVTVALFKSWAARAVAVVDLCEIATPAQYSLRVAIAYYVTRHASHRTATLQHVSK